MGSLWDYTAPFRADGGGSCVPDQRGELGSPLVALSFRARTATERGFPGCLRGARYEDPG